MRANVLVGVRDRCRAGVAGPNGPRVDPIVTLCDGEDLRESLVLGLVPGKIQAGDRPVLVGGVLHVPSQAPGDPLGSGRWVEDPVRSRHVLQAPANKGGRRGDVELLGVDDQHLDRVQVIDPRDDACLHGVRDLVRVSPLVIPR